LDSGETILSQIKIVLNIDSSDSVDCHSRAWPGNPLERFDKKWWIPGSSPRM